MINGKKEKVTIGKTYKFLTPKGDTIVYQLNDIPKNVVKDQPKINENNGTTATNYKEPAGEPKKQTSGGQSEIERLKEEARQKAKGNSGAATTTTVAETKAAAETKPAESKKTAVEKETKAVAAEKAKAPVKEEKKTAAAVIEKEEKKTAETQKSKYEFKKYYVADQNINATNIASQDTLKFITTDLSVYKDFPSLQFGSGESLSLCYDYVVKAYHGYDEALQEKYSTRYKVCHVGNWSEKRKSVEVSVDTKTGKKKLNYSIVQLDDKNLVLVKR